MQFPFHFIPADGPPDEVASRIRREFAYQAEHDLADVSCWYCSYGHTVSIAIHSLYVQERC